MLLLAAAGLYAVLLIRIAGKMHRDHLWEPLGRLHEMVRQVRRGNLNASAPVPRSLEVGPLVESFLCLTAEVREMRESLEQKVAERTVELEAAQKQLVQATKLSAMGQLVSGVAHEVNNPLTSILGFSEVLLGNPKLTAQGRAHLETIRDEALRLKRVVAGLSTFARRGPQRMERLDARRVLDKLVELRKYQLTAAGTHLHVERPEQPASVQGDADQLLQVLFNLVLNAEQAIQEARETGDIWLGCEVAGEGVRITVRDNRAGMKPDRLNIYWAGILALERAVRALATRPQHLLVDARTLRGLDLPQRGIVHGDALSLTIAAASILAKTARDALMAELDARHPGYGLARHKGYPTPEHLQALKERGPCPIHRRSFAPVREALGEAPPQAELFGKPI